jgi:hypothetical protein
MARIAILLALPALAAAARGASIVKSGREARTAAPMTQVPEQIRLVFTSDPTSMMVFWATSNKTLDTYVPTVQYGPTPGASAGRNARAAGGRATSPPRGSVYGAAPQGIPAESRLYHAHRTAVPLDGRGTGKHHTPDSRPRP